MEELEYLEFRFLDPILSHIEKTGAVIRELNLSFRYFRYLESSVFIDILLPTASNVFASILI